MNEITPITPDRLLIWSDWVLDLRDILLELAWRDPIYIVGGAVRDAYLHHPVKDLDLAVSHGAITLAKRLVDAVSGDVYIMDRERGVARVWLPTNDDQTWVVDVADFRGGRLSDDLQDRDLTMNALAVDLIGDPSQVFDPLGGINDLKHKTVRRCSPSSLQDDPIRTIRVVRQSVQFGFRIEPETLQDARDYAPHLNQISGERIRDEFWKLLTLRNPSQGLRVAERLGVLQAAIPALESLENKVLLPPHVYPIWQHTFLLVEKLTILYEAISPQRTDNTAAKFDMAMLVIQLDRYRSQLLPHISQAWANEREHRGLWNLTAVLHHLGSRDKIEQACVDLKLSKPEMRCLQFIVEHHEQVWQIDTWGVLEMHRFWYRLGEAGIDVCLFAAADYLATVGNTLQQDQWLKLVERIMSLLSAYFDRYEEIVQPPKLLDGNDIKQAFPDVVGQQIGEVLNNLREAQVIGDVDSKENAITWIRNYLNRKNS